MARKQRKRRHSRLIRYLLTVAVFLVLFSVVKYAAPSLLYLGNSSGELTEIYKRQPTDGEIEVHVIDVGQADSVLIRSAGGIILIDAGTNESEQALKSHLKYCGIDTVDYLICTHPHNDHIGGADMIVKDFNVGTVLMTDAVSAESSFERLLDGIESTETPAEIPSLGDSYTLGEIKFTVLAPIEKTEDLNGMSLVIKLEFGNTSFLFTGDVEAESEAALLGYFGAQTLDCDFYKVGHHGSDTSSSTEFLAAVTPSIAVISCGKDNTYGHPRGEVLERLAQAGCETVLRTDLSGTVVVRSDGKELTVVTPKGE